MGEKAAVSRVSRPSFAGRYHSVQMSTPRAAFLGGWTMIGGALLFLSVVVGLHLLQPGYDPRTQLMSELVFGRGGGAMLLAFAGLAASMWGAQMAVGSLGGSRSLRVLLIAGAALFMAAGLFPLGERAAIHIGAISVAFVAAVLAMYLFPRLGRAAAQASPHYIAWPLAGAVAASVAAGHSILPMGIGQRAAAAFLLVWFLVTGWRFRRMT